MFSHKIWHEITVETLSIRTCVSLLRTSLLHIRASLHKGACGTKSEGSVVMDVRRGRMESCTWSQMTEGEQRGRSLCLDGQCWCVCVFYKLPHCSVCGRSHGFKPSEQEEGSELNDRGFTSAEFRNPVYCTREERLGWIHTLCTRQTSREESS